MNQKRGNKSLLKYRKLNNLKNKWKLRSRLWNKNQNKFKKKRKRSQHGASIMEKWQCSQRKNHLENGCKHLDLSKMSISRTLQRWNRKMLQKDSQQWSWEVTHSKRFKESNTRTRKSHSKRSTDWLTVSYQPLNKKTW